MNFPDFNTWHKVPKDATIPAGTPYWRIEQGTARGYYVGTGLSYDRDLRSLPSDYYTEQPIPDPTEAAIWERAKRMYRIVHPSMDFAWEYQSQDTKDRWYTVATEKYDEKED